MNPYYQIDEEPKRKRTGLVAVIAVVSVLVAMLAAVLLALPALTEPQETVPGGSEPVWGESRHEPPEETAGLSSVPAPEDWRVVKYYEPEVVAEWFHEVYSGMKAISDMRWDVFERGGAQVGLFDFKCDGVPEIVLLYVGSPDIGETDGCRMEVFDWYGQHLTTYVWDEYADFSFFGRASAGGAYPCTASLNESVSVTVVGDPSLSYNREGMYLLDGYDMRPVYSSHTQGETMTFTYGDEVLALGQWNTRVNSFEQVNPVLYSTTMDMYAWEADTNLYELVKIMVNSDQRFVMPEEEAYPVVEE